MDTKKNHTPENEQPDEAGAPATGAAPATNEDDTVQQLKDQLLRKAAEFENYRRRTREENTQLIFRANEALIRELLPVIDDFERSIKAKATATDLESYASGVELVYTKLMRMLEKRGLEPMDSVGKAFDVDYHDALIQMPTDAAAPGIILEEIERGYLLNDHVLRHAKVVVAAEPASPVDREKGGGLLQ